MRRLLRTGLIGVIAAFGAHAAPAQQVRWSDTGWVRTGDAHLESFAGRETLAIENGSAALPGVRWQDGTVDVDVRTTTRRSFVYVNFRMQDEAEHEEFYLRPHKSSLPDAAQYSPVYQRQSAWQLYFGDRGTAPVEIVPDKWQHLRIVLSGERAAFFLDDTLRPFMTVRLARPARPGYIGLASFVPAGTPGSGPAVRYANLVVRTAPPGSVEASAPSLPPLDDGVVTRWAAGPSFAAPDSAIARIDPAWVRDMSAVAIEPEGFVELHRHRKVSTEARYTGAVLRFQVDAVSDGLRRLDLGFSDRITLFVNGIPLFNRDDSYDYATRRDGLMSIDQASAWVPLRAGRNTIDAVVTDRFGGWGIMARFADMHGLTLLH